MTEPPGNPIWDRLLDYDLSIDEDLFMKLVAAETIDIVPGSALAHDHAPWLLRRSGPETEHVAQQLIACGLILEDEEGYRLNPAIFADAIAARMRQRQ